MIITNLRDIPKFPGVYLIYTPNINRPPYPGSSMNLWYRFNKDSEYKILKDKRPIVRALKRYGGLKNCKIEIFHYWETPVDKLEVQSLETACIDYFDSLKEKGGYNICLFGNNTYGTKLSEKTKKLLSAQKKGENHPNWGKHLSEETKENQRKAWKIKIQNGYIVHNKGKKHSKKAKQLMKQNHASVKGEKNGRYDHKIYKFQNKSTNDIFEGTRFEFVKKYNLSRICVVLLLQNKIKYTKDWVLIK